MGKRSAGLLVYRLEPTLQLLLVHPGGPFWAKKDERAWSIPKGEIDGDDDAWGTARREFHEELGLDPPAGPPIDLGEVTQSGGKRVQAWAVAGDLDVTTIESNTFELEWPPRSGTRQEFPEVDRAGWFSPVEARTKLIAAQVELVDRLVAQLATEAPPGC